VVSPLGQGVLVVVPGTSAERARAERLLEELTSCATARVVTAGSATDDDVSRADVIVLIAATLDDVPGAAATDTPVVVDLSTVDVVSWLLEAPAGSDRSAALRDLVARADLVLASDPRQRDILLGALAGQVRVNAAVYDRDPSLLSLVRTDPSGAGLADFCRQPVRAADANLPPFVRPTKPNDLTLAMQYLRDGGPAALAGRVAHRVQRLYRQRARRTAR
jgi:hypothetical protein